MAVAGNKLGSYELLAEIAHGSTTDVLLARARGMAGFERHVVIKRVREERAGDSSFTEAFITEARLAATLHHHHIVQVQDIAEADGVPYFAMEYVHGEDLRALLAHVHARGESVPIAHVLTIGLAVAAALHQAHEHGIVHRDVTPANIIVGYDGNVKVVDFGMAKAAITPGTQVGIKKGKAPYMAPEQCRGEKVDRRSDVFALGIVLYELITARRLFKGASDHDTMSMIVRGTIPSPREHRPTLAPELAGIIMKALARLPNDRYQSTADLALSLEAYSGASGVVGSSSALGTYLREQLGERKEPWLAGGSVRPTAPVDFDGEEAGIAVPAGETPDTKTRRPAAASTLMTTPPKGSPVAAAPFTAAGPFTAANDDDDDEMAEETATTEMPSEQLADQVAEALRVPRVSTATEVDLPTPPKAIPSVTRPSSGGLKPGAFSPKGAVAVPAPKATAFAKAAPSTDVAKTEPTPVVPAPPVVAKAVPAPPVVPKAVPAPPVVANAVPAPPVAPKLDVASTAEKPNWDSLSTNVPRLPPPPRVAPRISTPPASMPKLEAAALALDGKLAGATTDPRPAAATKRARRGSTAPITSDASEQARGEIVVETQRAAVDMTELVQPLPLDIPPTAPVAMRARTRRRILLAAIGCSAVFVAIVVAIAFSGGYPGASSRAATAASPTAPPSGEKPAMPAPSAAAAAEPPPAPASGEMTWNGVLDAGTVRPAAATIDAAPVAVAPAPAVEPENPAPAVEPQDPPKQVVKPRPKATAKRAPPMKSVPVAKPATRPAKPTKAGAPLKYDPNSLFLSK